MALLTKGRKIPQLVALLLSGSISQTCKKILQLYRFNFLYVHITTKLDGLKNWWFDENARNHFITNKLLAHHGFITGLTKRKICISLLASIVFSYHHFFILMSGKMNQIGIDNQSVIYTFYHFIKIMIKCLWVVLWLRYSTCLCAWWVSSFANCCSPSGRWDKSACWKQGRVSIYPAQSCGLGFCQPCILCCSASTPYHWYRMKVRQQPSTPLSPNRVRTFPTQSYCGCCG